MAPARQDVENLVNTMAEARMPVVNNWDVLCSYDLKALNAVLLKEYQKHPVNSRMEFSKTKSVLNMPLRISCALEFGNPTLNFVTAESAIYSLNIPINDGSYCNQTFQGKFLRTAIPDGYQIVASGPILTVTGSGRFDDTSKTFKPNDIVEFGDHEKASVVLHFGKDLRNVRITPLRPSAPENDLLYEITNEFSNNVNQVNYNIVQVVRNTTTPNGLVLTPKSFIITTMADDNDRESGALSVWVQTNESGRPKGNPQPSFYPGTPVLSVPLGYTSSIVFSHHLINEIYLKPALEKFYEVKSGDIIVNNKKHLDALSLVPRNKPKESFRLVAGGIEDRSYEYEIEYQRSPFYIYAYKDQLRLTWNYETSLVNVETKIVEDGVLGTVIAASIGAAFYIIIAPIAGSITGKTLDKIKKYLKLSMRIDKAIPFTSIDNTRFSAKMDLKKGDLDVDVILTDSVGFSIIKKVQINWEDVRTMLVPKLEQTIFMPDIDFGTLDYFAEANILFNEDRFRMSPDKAIHFPHDTMVIGDINIDDTNLEKNLVENPSNRQKREERPLMKNSAGGLSSPINTAIKWFTTSMSQLKSFNPMTAINKIFFEPPQLISDDINKSCIFHPNAMTNFDHNSFLILSDFFVRTLTKTKHYVSSEEPSDLLDAKAYAINIVEEFEEILNDTTAAIADFDPVVLMSKLEKEVINGNHKNVKNILLNSMQTPGEGVEEKLTKMIQKQDDLFKQNHLWMQNNNLPGASMDYFKL